MRLKSDLYKKEQADITDKIIDILELDNNNAIILYHLDNDIQKQNKIMNLVPDIKKYYTFSSSIGVSDSSKAKRPYVSIIRQFTKIKYNMISSDYMIKLDTDKIIRTKKYTFIKK